MNLHDKRALIIVNSNWILKTKTIDDITWKFEYRSSLSRLSEILSKINYLKKDKTIYRVLNLLTREVRSTGSIQDFSSLRKADNEVSVLSEIEMQYCSVFRAIRLSQDEEGSFILNHKKSSLKAIY